MSSLNFYYPSVISTLQKFVVIFLCIRYRHRYEYILVMEFFEKQLSEHFQKKEPEFEGNIGGESWEKINRNMRNTLNLDLSLNSSAQIGEVVKKNRNSKRRISLFAKISEAKKCPQFTKALSFMPPKKKTMIYDQEEPAQFQPYKAKQESIKRENMLNLKKRPHTEEAKIEGEQQSPSYQEANECLEEEMRRARKYFSYSFHLSLFKHKQRLKEHSLKKRKNNKMEICKQNIKVYAKQELQEIKKIHSKPLNPIKSKKPSPTKNLFCPINTFKPRNILRIIPLKPTKLFL